MNALINGTRYQGKTTLALALALADREKTVIIFDSYAQYHVGLNCEASLESLDQMLLAPPADPLVLLYRPDPKAISEGFTALTEYLWDQAWEQYTLIIDEAWEIQSSHGLNENLGRLIRRKPDTVSVIQTTHRIVDLQALARFHATDLFFFRTERQGDLDMIESEYGFDAAMLRNLPLHVCIHRWLDPQTGAAQLVTWHDTKRWYSDITGNRPRGRSRNSDGAGAGSGDEFEFASTGAAGPVV